MGTEAPEAALASRKKEPSPQPLTSRAEGLGGGGVPGWDHRCGSASQPPPLDHGRSPHCKLLPTFSEDSDREFVGCQEPQPLRLLGWQLSPSLALAGGGCGRPGPKQRWKSEAWFGLCVSPSSSCPHPPHGVRQGLPLPGSLGEVEEGREAPSQPAPEPPVPWGGSGAGPRGQAGAGC